MLLLRCCFLDGWDSEPRFALDRVLLTCPFAFFALVVVVGKRFALEGGVPTIIAGLGAGDLLRDLLRERSLKAAWALRDLFGFLRKRLAQTPEPESSLVVDAPLPSFSGDGSEVEDVGLVVGLLEVVGGLGVPVALDFGSGEFSSAIVD